MVYTNNVPGGYMRTPGTPQMMFAVESQVDMIARELGIDPLEFRRMNALREGDSAPAGGRLERVRCLEVLDAAASAAGWDQPKRTPATGRGVALFHRKPGGQRAGTLGHLRLVLDDSHSISVTTALPDQGTGIYTVVRQVIAEVLGLQPSAIDVRTADTSEIPVETGIGGSKSTHIHGQAALQAAEQLRERLLEAAAGLLDVYPEDVELVAGGFRRRSQSPDAASAQLSFAEAADEALRRADGRIEILETYTPPDGLAPVTSFCAQVVELEVDPETGAVDVRRIVSAHDVGTIINPMFHQGQIDGGVVQALGYALTEELHIEEGHVLNPNLGEYKMPTSSDIPELITVLLEEPAGPGPFDGKAIGEIPNVSLPAAIANAVADAVGVRIQSLPITAEKVYEALKPRN
jgi:CO/xanthine dehydrogenase Mo-binding subunit